MKSSLWIKTLLARLSLWDNNFLTHFPLLADSCQLRFRHKGLKPGLVVVEIEQLSFTHSH